MLSEHCVRLPSDGQGKVDAVVTIHSAGTSGPLVGRCETGFGGIVMLIAVAPGFDMAIVEPWDGSWSYRELSDRPRDVDGVLDVGRIRITEGK